jgi:hypothetical protein
MKSLLAVVLFALLGLFAPGAHAQTSSTCNTAASCSQGEAYAECVADTKTYMAANAGTQEWTFTSCTVTQSVATHDGYRGSGTITGIVVLMPHLHWFLKANTCSVEPEETGWAYDTQNPSNVCHEGCAYSGALDPDSPTGASYAPTGATCEPLPENEPIPDADGDGVPDEDDVFPNDPNESADSDGDGIGDNADFAPNDPNDGSDTPGEEDGDDEGDNHASGGGDCNAPPTCSGDGIQCAQLMTQWKIMCKGARVTGSPEICLASYTCEGDSAQCTEIALLRKTACGIEGLESGIGGGGDSAAQELVDGLQGGPADQNINPMSVWLNDEESIEADTSGFGLPRACPAPTQFMGQTIDNTGLCSLTAMIGAIVMLVGFAHFAWAFTQS